MPCLTRMPTIMARGAAGRRLVVQVGGVIRQFARYRVLGPTYVGLSFRNLAATVAAAVPLSSSPFGRISGRQLTAVLHAIQRWPAQHRHARELQAKPSSPRTETGPPWGSVRRSTKMAPRRNRAIRLRPFAPSSKRRPTSAERRGFPRIAAGRGSLPGRIRPLHGLGLPVGAAAWRAAGPRRELLAGNYVQACDEMLAYRKLTSSRKGRPRLGREQAGRAQGRPLRCGIRLRNPPATRCAAVPGRASSSATRTAWRPSNEGRRDRTLQALAGALVIGACALGPGFPPCGRSGNCRTEADAMAPAS